MGSFRRTAVLVLGSLVAAACGGDGGNGPGAGPTANFDPPSCTNQICTFTDASTATSGRTIASRQWTFENGNPATSTASPVQVTFSTAGPNTATLTVTDNAGDSDNFSREVTVTLPTTLTAEFTFTCASDDCTFADASAPAAGGSIVAWNWNFGDGSPASTEQNPTHSYTVADLQTFDVTLTVTDNNAQTASVTHQVSAAPPATLTCGTTPDCSLILDAPSRVTVTLVSSDCQLPGNTFKAIITRPGQAPVEQVLFTDGCNTPDGTSFQLQNNEQFAQDTEIQAQIISGGTNLEIAPAVRVTGNFTDGWTLEFDDGAKAGPPPEPDFNDLIISIVAAP